MPLGLRGANPIWLLDDSFGHLFDGTCYMWVLQNQIPYIPALVYHDPDLQTVWSQPIQFYPNGTLPIDIFFEQNVVYRLEFRQNDGFSTPTQSDPLIYLVENYTADGTGTTPINAGSSSSSNEITNPQFALSDFVSPLVISGQTNPPTIDIAPGWTLDLLGTGNATISIVPLNNSNKNPTNAPYALRLTLSGWNTAGVILTQRFQQNGMLWANKVVSASITALVNGVPQGLSGILIDSNGVLIGNVLSVNAINGVFNEYKGHSPIASTSNPNLPPSAYIDYKIIIPSNIDIYLTSIQLIVQTGIEEPTFIQDSVDRQLDHTFHVYKDSLITQPKENLLVGWNFALNPYQTRLNTAVTTLVNQYATDQTIIVQNNYVSTGAGSNLSTSQATYVNNYGFQVTALTATNRFSMIQYVDPVSIRPYWGYNLSCLVKLSALRQNASTPLRMKLRLIYRTSLPSLISQTEPIASIDSNNEPVFSNGWTSIIPTNDPVYNLTNGNNTLTFEGLKLPACTSDTMTMGLVIYILDPMIQTGTPDNIIFNSVSLVPNDFATDCNVLSFDETLAKCQYYFETSYDPGIALGDTTGATALFREQYGIKGTPNDTVRPRSFEIMWKRNKRARPTTPNTVLYSNFSGAAGSVAIYINQGGAATPYTIASTPWTLANLAKYGAIYISNATTAYASTSTTADLLPEGFIEFHYVVNTRLGN